MECLSTRKNKEQKKMVDMYANLKEKILTVFLD